MSTDNGQPRRLNPDDPVPPEVLQRLRALQEARFEVSDRILTLEQEKVRLLASARRIDEERQRTFEGVLVERGLTPESVVEIDAGTGRLKVIETKPPAAQAPTA